MTEFIQYFLFVLMIGQEDPKESIASIVRHSPSSSVTLLDDVLSRLTGKSFERLLELPEFHAIDWITASSVKVRVL